MAQIKLSIITINYNNRHGLSSTIQSVINQTYQGFEYIIIDGGSLDGSQEVIIKYQSYLSYWCSEKDNGVYHAMNKGVVRAKGEYLLFLNSGDILFDDEVLERVIPFLNGTGIVYGDLVFKGNGSETVFNYPDVLDMSYLFYRSLGHPSSFIRRDLFKDSLYSEDLKIVSDWEFFFKKILLEKTSYQHMNVIVSIFDTNGISSCGDACLKEHEMVLHRMLPGDLYAIVEEYLAIRKSPIYPLLKDLMKTKKLQYRIYPLLKRLIRFNALLKKKRR